MLSNRPEIDAEPTKAFFVDMLTRDIPLEQAILDLVDNSVDAAKVASQGGSLDGKEVKIEFNDTHFRIFDNCGGFDSTSAAKYAFRFGRPSGTPRTPHSIGQFGVGMKRALFKFGHHFVVRSATTTDSWAIDVDVPQWEAQVKWNFPWADFIADANVSTDSPGTEIVVSALRKEVATRFATKYFENAIIQLIKSKHRQFISAGLKISVNGQHIDAVSLFLLMTDDSKFRPGTDELVYKNPDGIETKVRIIVGIGQSAPREAGWYVICNGRVVLEANRTSATGWGLVEEASNTIQVPSFHNQFARFRGIVSFDSEDSSCVPWNTTKTDVDQDNPVWQLSFTRMKELMRPVITFLNELDSDIDEHTRDHSPMLDFVNQARSVKAEQLPAKSVFAAPARGTVTKTVKTVKIQYSKPQAQINFLMKELSVASASAVGQRTFELMYERLEGE
nr:ATP-binding protein [uncultured Duganella sp.]